MENLAKLQLEMLLARLKKESFIYMILHWAR